MPHGPITPLGRQLRSVLADIRPRPIDTASPTLTFGRSQRSESTGKAVGSLDESRPQHGDPSPPKKAHASHSTEAAPAAADSPEDPGMHQSRPGATESTPHTRRYRRFGRGLPSNALNAALIRANKRDVVPLRFPGKTTLAVFDARGRHGRRRWLENRQKHAHDIDPGEGVSTVSKLWALLAKYIRHVATRSDSGIAETASFDGADMVYLSDRGYSLDDLRAWSAIVTEADSFEAAAAIQGRVASHGTHAVPLFVISYVLLRPYISAQALRILYARIWELLNEMQPTSSQPYSSDTAFTVFVRLVRHARAVWPQFLESITQNMLQCMQKTITKPLYQDRKALQRITFMANKAMYLVSEPMAVAPFKDNQHQEAAIIHLLAFMAESDPNLQLNREGYRAVVRIQLAQKKTESERQWADLKALSWPPWKEDRTSMDSEIQPEHGITKAGDTLRRMKEAGYAPERWEEVAEIYSGWDTDNTPTIQTRAILPSRAKDLDQEAAIWEARVRTTRNIQEAWACYLAYEDTGLPLDQGVLLAIFEKLHSEEKRQRRQEKPTIREFLPHRQSREGLLPGDAPEISPLPPSTHLYTYTRTVPPTVHQFFAELRKNGTKIGARCLAFIVANASSFRIGLEYLKYGKRFYPGIEGFLAPGSDVDLKGTPSTVLDGFIMLLTRFPDRRMRVSQPTNIDRGTVLTKTHGLRTERLNLRHSLVRAMALLEAQRPRSLVPWNAVLVALGRDRVVKEVDLAASGFAQPEKRENQNSSLNKIMAYKLMHQVLDLLRSRHFDLDTVGFLALCRATEKAAIASWKTLLEGTQEAETSFDAPQRPVALTEAKELFRKNRPHWRLEQYFKLLVGDESYLDTSRKPGEPPKTSFQSILGLPRLLTNPGPALLHAYIRALGWWGAHDRLHATAKWMVEYRSEISESRAKDRNGEAVMRRALVALRVFLERSWLERATELRAEEPAADRQHRPLALQRLEAVAPREVIDEVRELVEGVEEWGGWPEDEEVERYCLDARFEQFR